MAPKRLLRLPATMKKSGKGRSSIYDGVSKGTFPKPIKIGARSVAWLENEIDEWIQSRIDASRSRDHESAGPKK